MTNNNNKEYAAIQKKPAKKYDTDLLEYMKMPVRYTNTNEFPLQSTASNTKIPKKETMVLQKHTSTAKHTFGESRPVNKLETVATHNEYKPMETEKTYITKDFSKHSTVNWKFKFLKPSVSSNHSNIRARKKSKEEVIKTDTVKSILPANPNIYPNFIFNYDNEKYFVVEEISPEKFEAGLWDYIKKPLHPERTKRCIYKRLITHDLLELPEFIEPVQSLPLGIKCDNLSTLTTMFHHIPETNQRGNVDFYICSSCNNPSNGLPGNQCHQCEKIFHWKCVAHTEHPNYGITWFCEGCLRKFTENNPETPYFHLFNDALHYGRDKQ